VEQFVAMVQPSFLCMDYYPYFEPRQQFAHFNRMPATTRGRGMQTMENYLQNVAILRQSGLRHGLRWWNYFGAADFQGHTAATEKQLELQVSQCITIVAQCADQISIKFSS